MAVKETALEWNLFITPLQGNQNTCFRVEVGVEETSTEHSHDIDPYKLHSTTKQAKPPNLYSIRGPSELSRRSYLGLSNEKKSKMRKKQGQVWKTNEGRSLQSGTVTFSQCALYTS